MSNSPFVWLNGRLQPQAEARLSPLDHGLMVGDGVFETLTAHNGRPFASHEHYERLLKSCKATGLHCLPKAEYEAAMAAVLQANDLQEARVRVTLTSGDGPLGSGRGDGPGTVLVVATPLKPWPPSERVLLVPWTRNTCGALAGVKSVSYGENVVALAHARKEGCGEALLANEKGDLCEGTGSNIFVVVRGRLLTPPLASGCLAGITRRLVLKACVRAGISCEEKTVPATVLGLCEEAFLTSSTRDVHPISWLNERTLQTPGPVTRGVQDAFASLVAEM